MEKTSKNKELQSRREFFKRAAKGALPILAAVAFASVPNVLDASTLGSASCQDCTGGCSSGCYRGCKSTCAERCTGMSEKYGGSACATCKELCAGCQGTCGNTCKGACYTTSYKG